MIDFVNRYASQLEDTHGLEMIDIEMSRQDQDIIETLETQRDSVRRLADDIRRTGKVLLLGMGASQLVNEIFALQLRRFHIDALAMTASEFIYDPVSVDSCTVVLTSQSGESVETVKCIPLLGDHPVFSVTLTEDSTIAKAGTAVVCAGGGEKAYAGTRSVTLSLAAFAAVCAQLGQIDEKDILPAVQWLREDYGCMERALLLLYNKRTVIATGRSLFAPIAHLYALGSEELSNCQTIYEETGTLRHGPMEAVDRDTVIVVFRQEGQLGELCRSFNDVRTKTGCSLIVFDASGLEPLTGAVTIPCPKGNDIIAALGMMTSFQYLMIAYACGKNPRAGLPHFGGKVTTTE